MRHFIKYLCGLLILLHFGSFAQQPSPGEKVVFSSPQAAQLGKFGGHTINYSTGTPNINIPLLTLSEGDLQIPISVQYNYSGFRPSDQPGWIGLG
ncbi:hypothetical protein, partial [Dyadobacter sp. LHD-138]|uniref:hypothetical protein n=1 Tax=Dyadobacter sp. LHD-138 TaxID=3071413 RepID=UPI0027DEE11F